MISSGSKISQLEQKLLESNQNYSYLPKKDFNGKTECFYKLDKVF